MEHSNQPPGMNKLDDHVWVRIPLFFYKKISKSLGLKLTDGNYLTGISPAFSFFPILLFLAGLKTGALHWGFESDNSGIEQLFTASLPFMILIVISSFLSASFGFWLWLGYALGDLFYFTLFAHIKGTFLPELGWLGFIKKVMVAHLIPAILFFFLAVNLRFVGKKLALKVFSAVKDQNTNRAILMPLLIGLWCGIIMYGWTSSAPILMLPVYTWRIGADPVSAGLIPPIESKWVIIIIAVLMAMLRQFFDEALSNAQKKGIALFAGGSGQPAISQAATGIMGSIASVLLITVTTVFLFSGLYQNWWDALYTGIFILCSTILVKYVIPGQTGLINLAGKVPLLFRFFVAALISWLITDNFISKEYFPVMLSYWPFIKGLFVSMIIFMLLLPDLTASLKTKPKIS